MRTNYHSDQRPSYECSSRADRLTTPTCRSVVAATVDTAVAAALLQALTPQQVALALCAADEVAGRHQRVSRAAQPAVELTRAVHPGTAKRTVPQAVNVIKQLGSSVSNQDLVTHLNTAGLRTGSGRPFDIAAVQWVRHAYQIPSPHPYAAGEVSVAEAARRLGCSTGVVYYWIESAQLDARRGPGNRLCITWTPKIEAACQRRIAVSGHLNPAARRGKPRTRR